ncbi:hypothetical protein NCC49_005643 [Naganishia albida]|nr:hypothetical protein NCC49_005643 [Naganishia albida]
MPLNIPNTLIYLAALLRPTRLKPDLRIPSISHVDWKRARRQGYNAVVIDKDNCLTWPHVDALHPSITQGWASLKEAFGPGNVLVVSNSAGTRKDFGGIAAESVSRALGVPVLLHAAPKPGCAADIVAFLSGEMPLRTVGGKRRTLDELGKGDGWDLVLHAEKDVNRFELVEQPERTLLGRQSTTVTPPPVSRSFATPAPPARETTIADRYRTPLDAPKILVIGDRLATDVLLARRLAAYYPLRNTQGAAAAAQQLADARPVLSIVTTELFQKSDVRLLRWLEESWLRFGLFLRERFAQRGGAQVEETLRAEELRRWILARSVDAPPENLVVAGSKSPSPGLAGRISNARAAWDRWTSVPSWSAWARALVPSRTAVWLFLGKSASRVGRSVGRVARRAMSRVRPASV